MEAINTAFGVDQLLLTGEEGVASGADFQANVSFMRGAGLELGAASTDDFNDVIGGVNSGFHDFPDCRIAQMQNARRGDQPATGVFC